MKVPEFLAWAESQEKGRHELVRGKIVTMPRECVAHVRAKMWAANSLETAIGRAGVGCQAFVSGLAVMIDDETSYDPDALVNCGEPGAGDAMIAPKPVIVVEVLSPSTLDLDKTTKLADYFRVPSLAHCLVVDLGRQHILHHRRQSDGAITVEVMRDGEITLDPPGITVAVADFLGD